MKKSHPREDLHEARALVRELVSTLKAVASLSPKPRAEASLLDDAVRLARRADEKLASEATEKNRAGFWQAAFQLVERVATFLIRIVLDDQRLNYTPTASERMNEDRTGNSSAAPHCWHQARGPRSRVGGFAELPVAA